MEDLLMIKIKPFKGLYYTDKSTKSNNLSRVVCPPYDIISDEQKAELKSKSKFNAVNLEAPDSYDEAKKSLDEWIKNKILTFDEAPSIYIYEISYKVNNEVCRLKGVVGSLKLPEKDEDYIIANQNTINDNKVDRIQLLDNTNCQFSPVFMLYEDNENEIQNLIRTSIKSNYLAKSKQNNIIHKIWKISDPEIINCFEELFENKTYYIADGHSRLEAACSYRDRLRKEQNISDDHPANFIMAFFVDQNDPALTILPTHRIVSNIDMFDSDSMLEQASQYFDIIRCKTMKSTRNTMFGLRRKNKNAFGIYTDGCYSVLVLKDDNIMKEISSQSDEYKSLDVTVLHKLFFEKILNIDSKQITYNQSANEACRCVDNGDACFAVFLSATRISEAIDISKNKENMPLNSTLFFPKPMAGLIFYSLNNKI